MYEIRVAVDFDRCLIEDIPSLSTCYVLRENAKDAIIKLTKSGAYFVLNTSRYGWYYRSAVRFIKSEGLPIHIERHKNKVPADIYIDDCNIFCQKINWYEIEEELFNVMKRRNEKCFT